LDDAVLRNMLSPSPPPPPPDDYLGDADALEVMAYLDDAQKATATHHDVVGSPDETFDALDDLPPPSSAMLARSASMDLLHLDALPPPLSPLPPPSPVREDDENVGSPQHDGHANEPHDLMSPLSTPPPPPPAPPSTGGGVRRFFASTAPAAPPAPPAPTFLIGSSTTTTNNTVRNRASTLAENISSIKLKKTAGASPMQPDGRDRKSSLDSRTVLMASLGSLSRNKETLRKTPVKSASALSPRRGSSVADSISLALDNRRLALSKRDSVVKSEDGNDDDADWEEE
jgi:hypothetical protein